jgi:serine/threonine-protein kinase
MSNWIGQHIGQYEIKAILGEGGMAAVYRARQESIKRDVAIKIIKPNLVQMTDFVRRFEREAQTIASLSHAHIVKIFDFGQHENTVYLVMELLTGGSLTDEIYKGPLSITRVSRLLDQIGSALDHAHRRGVIHRDLKPQNVLLDSDGDAFLTDFGIAKLMGVNNTALTQSGVAMGTPAYMPPEQWMGQPVDTRSDVYALGVMVYEMLTGKVPYNAETPFGLMHQHVYDPIPAMTTRSDLSPTIKRVVEKAMSKQSDQRFQSAGEFSEAFRTAMAGGTPIALESSPGSANVSNLAPQDRVASASKPNLVSPPPITPGSGADDLMQNTLGAAPRRAAWLPIVIVVAALAVIGVGALIVVPRLGDPTATVVAQTQIAAANTKSAAQTLTAIPTVTPTPSATLTPSLTPSFTPNAQTIAANIVIVRQTETANAIASFTRTPTPDLRKTAEQIVALTDTANAVASFTKTPSVTATVTPSHTPSSSPTATSTKTPLPPTAAPTNAVFGSKLCYNLKPEDCAMLFAALDGAHSGKFTSFTAHYKFSFEVDSGTSTTVSAEGDSIWGVNKQTGTGTDPFSAWQYDDQGSGKETYNGQTQNGNYELRIVNDTLYFTGDLVSQNRWFSLSIPLLINSFVNSPSGTSLATLTSSTQTLQGLLSNPLIQKQLLDTFGGLNGITGQALDSVSVGGQPTRQIGYTIALGEALKSPAIAQLLQKMNITAISVAQLTRSGNALDNTAITITWQIGKTDNLVHGFNLDINSDFSADQSAALGISGTSAITLHFSIQIDKIGAPVNVTPPADAVPIPLATPQ